MDKESQDIQQLDPEESDPELGGEELPSTLGRHTRRETPVWKGMFPPYPPLCQRLCSSHNLSLFILGFDLILLVAICEIASRRAQLQMELWTLKVKYDNFSSSIRMEMESQRFLRGSTGSKVTSLEAEFEKQRKELQADHSSLHIHLKHFPVDLHTLSCQMAFFRSNGTECCPVNWIDFKGNCYWFSQLGTTWSKAKSYCQLEKAHLVVINSEEEQKFIVEHTHSFEHWIGLTQSNGSWKWVDGTDFVSNYRHRNSLQSKGAGSSKDCGEILRDGFWNTEACLNFNRWVCEMKSNITSAEP